MRIQLAFTLLMGALLVGCDSTSTSTTSSTPSSTTTVQKPSLPDRPTTTTPGERAPDNTGVNKRDRDPDAKTPIDQKENQADVDRTATIRKRVLEIDNLSVDGRNVKIITADGKVTLRGPVANTAERAQIEAIAKEVAGDSNVDSQLEVAPQK